MVRAKISALGPGHEIRTLAARCWLLAALCAGGEGCSSLPRTKVPTTATPAPLVRAQERTFGLIEIFPLPRHYEKGYVPIERCFTGELWSTNPKSSLMSRGLVFVPSDYKEIVGASFLHALREQKVAVTQHATVEEAARAGADLVVAISPARFAVLADSHTSQVDLHYVVIDPTKRDIIWSGAITNTTRVDDLPPSIHSRTLIFMVGTHSLNFQPERTLLALGTQRNVMDFLRTIETVLPPK